MRKKTKRKDCWPVHHEDLEQHGKISQVEPKRAMEPPVGRYVAMTMRKNERVNEMRHCVEFACIYILNGNWSYWRQALRNLVTSQAWSICTSAKPGKVVNVSIAELE